MVSSQVCPITSHYYALSTPLRMLQPTMSGLFPRHKSHSVGMSELSRMTTLDVMCNLHNVVWMKTEVPGGLGIGIPLNLSVRCNNSLGADRTCSEPGCFQAGHAKPQERK
jgi:hypothetical protein